MSRDVMRLSRECKVREHKNSDPMSQGSAKVAGVAYHHGHECIAAKKPLTPRLAVPPLPNGEGEKSKSQPSPRGEGARRRRTGEWSLSTLLDFDGALSNEQLRLRRRGD
jgi:hypothetical protein